MGQGGQCSVLGTEGPPPTPLFPGDFLCPLLTFLFPPKTANGNVEAKVVCLFRRRDISSSLNSLADSNARECRLLRPGGGWWWRGVGGLWLHSHPPHTHSPRLGCGGGQIPACRCSGLRVFGSLRVLGEGVRLRCCPPTRGGGSWPVPSHHPWGDLGGGGVSCSFGVTDAPWWVGGGMGGLGGVGRAQSGLTAPPPPPQPAMQGGSEPDGGAGGGSWGCPTPTRLPACVNRAGLLPPAPPLGLGCCQNPEGGVPGEQCASLLDGGTERGAPSDIPPCACAQASSRRSPSSPP